MSRMGNHRDKPPEHEFKPLIVWLILNKRTEEALTLLAKNYKVNTPKLKVGLPKRHKKNVFGCYTPNDETISVLNSDVMGNSFVILHEFYHHLRTHSADRRHKGTEKNANKFATEFLREYEAAKRQQGLG
jgi:Zn-dependent peptidase ImmA (M78 family)